MKRMITAIKPTGSSITLGNYLGCLLPTIKYQDGYDLYIFIADLHALTIYQKPEELRENIKTLLATYLAAGLDPNKCVLFRQSDISAHNKLEWIITCNTQLPDLTKMPQFKNYQDKHKGEAVPAGMLNYVNLMTADILLYDIDLVPAGQDQLSHIFLTRLQAETFNKLYGDTFKLPEPVLQEHGAKIMSLSDPTKKMSKSESDIGTIYILDDETTVRKKIKKAVTDPEGKIYYNPETKPGISNLLVILSCLSGRSIEELEDYYKDKPDYGKFKSDVADAVWSELSKLQEKIKQYKDSDSLESILYIGACKAKEVADVKINEVYKKVGLK